MTSWITTNAGIFVVFSIFAGIVLGLVVGSGSAWKRKAPLIVVVPFLAFLVVASLNGRQGWPVSAYPPNKSIVVGEYIVEANPVNDDPGVIYITAFPPGATKPREYKIPYSRQAEAQLLAGKRIRQQGGVSVYKRERKIIKVYKLPPAHLPSKGDRQP